jgi:hypothetical protein
MGLWLLVALPVPPAMAATGDGEWGVAQDHLHVTPNIGPHGHSQTPPSNTDRWLAPARAHERPASTDILNTPRPAAAVPAANTGASRAETSGTPPGRVFASSHRPRAPPRA